MLKDCVVIDIDGAGRDWFPALGRYDDCIFAGLSFRASGFYEKSHFNRCTFIMCGADTEPARHLRLEACRGVLLTSVDEGLRQWGLGLSCCGREFAKKYGDKRTCILAAWEEILLSCFEGDPQKLSWSGHEIQVKLRQVDLAYELVKRRGKVVIVSGSASADHDECRVVDCDAFSVKLFNMSTKMNFKEVLRGISFEHIEPLHLTVGGRRD